MAIKYRYYDDALEEEAKLSVKLMEEIEPDLEIELDTPKRYDRQIDLLRELTDGSYDGVILDLRLDQTANEVEGGGREKANYRATTLAQEMRTLGTEKRTDELPIVMWSAEKKLRKSFFPDETGHDLFDLTSSKEDLVGEGAREMARRLVALANGYKRIRKLKSEGKSKTFHYLGFDEAPLFLDERIVAYFDDRRRAPAHEYARFVIHSLLNKPGPLIGEDILAARLGVGAEASSDWEELRDNVLREARYDGPFAGGWPRWWAFLVEAWWQDSNPLGSLRNATARERVQHLTEATGLRGIVPAEPIAKQYSSRYWTICLALSKPLDPLDGLQAMQGDLKPWHDRPYLSKKAALEEKRRSQGLRVSPVEKAKLERLKGRA